MKFDFPIEKVEYAFDLVGKCNIDITINGRSITGNVIHGHLLKGHNVLKINFTKDDPTDTKSYATLKEFTVNGGNFIEQIKKVDYNIIQSKHKDAGDTIKNNLYFGYVGSMDIVLEQTDDLLKKAAWTIADKEFEYVKWPFRGENYRTKNFSTVLSDATYMYTGLVSPATHEINQAIDKLSVGDLRLPLDISKDRKKIEHWINRSSRITLMGMDKMKNFTISQGVMDSLNSFITTADILYMPEKTYFFQGEILQDKKVIVKDAFNDELKDGSSVLFELPSPWYSTSDIQNKIVEAHSKNCKVALDLTWLPAINEHIHIDMALLDQIFFSMNKTWPIHDLRPAFRWSKDRINDQQTFQQEYCSYTKIPPNVFMKLIDEFELDFVYEKYKKSADQLCKTFELQPTSVLWFTKHKRYKTNLKEHISKYYFLDDFVCLRKLLDYKDKYFW